MAIKFKSSCAGCFSGLSCNTRTEIVTLLQKKKRMSVTEIAKHFKVTQPTITHHLHYLKTVGILSAKKQDRHIYYYINPKCGWDNCQIFI
ncbi:MAG: Transcriptional regulator, ArsR [Parcubacteria group bacterium GW2011_GWA1_45_7]|nr:MAG: Transcriptional regulator, ArsR [Parcubacteria group bacterium GW2011_GWA1_45_7]KKU11183.1 MAG: Transcriptional regulator, ArsR [Parcubacteria group bacterium GW2011_GWF1_45_5]KKU47390.1 MAG: Transcriptional regulator, ArsR [Parcubacteria group bacterium GW2011_GWF2_46_8]